MPSNKNLNFVFYLPNKALVLQTEKKSILIGKLF